jgi:hypothetical protein
LDVLESSKSRQHSIEVVESLMRTMFRRMRMMGPDFTAFRLRRSPVSGKFAD